MKNILIYINHFYPGVNSGGQSKTIQNLVNLMNKDIKMKIVTRNHDFNSNVKYNLKTDVELNYNGKTKIYYSSKGFRFKLMKKLEFEYNNIIHCGFFEPFSYKNFFKLIFYKPKKKFIILPMGVFSPGAIKYKKFKKILFIFFFNFFKLYNKIYFAFSSSEEYKHANSLITLIPNYFLLQDIPSIKSTFGLITNPIPKILFLSRIHPIKNLDFAITILDKLNKQVIFHIYGPLEDKAYWNECLIKLNNSKNIISWNYYGSISNETTGTVFSNYDFFIFPTKGENFGHVVFESMVNGCIPIISNLTPWTKLFNNRLDFSCDVDDMKCFINKANYLLDNFDSINKVKLKYIKEANSFYTRTYGSKYIRNFLQNLI